VLSLRQKHTQQQKIVNKLIQFLVALVQPRMGGAMKRRYGAVPGLQLAIEEGGPSGGKEPRLEVQGGPVIQEMEEQDISSMTGSQLQDFLNITQEATVTTPVEVVEQQPTFRRAPQPQPTMKQEVQQQEEHAGPSAKYRLVDPASVNPALIQQIVKSDGMKRPVLHREISKEDFDLDINSMQKELDNLKEILSGQITLDSTLVSSLFNVDDGMPMNLFNEHLLNHEEEAGVSQPASDAANNSLVTYNPDLFELTEVTICLAAYLTVKIGLFSFITQEDHSPSGGMMAPPSTGKQQQSGITIKALKSQGLWFKACETIYP
jgi:hypothetical protein